MDQQVMHFEDSTFNSQVLQSTQPVLVDFWAEWCMPCRFVAPVVEAIAKEYAGKVKVGKLDVDANPETASRYGINSIPTLLVFKNGKVAGSVVGAVPKEKIQQLLNKNLSQ